MSHTIPSQAHLSWVVPLTTVAVEMAPRIAAMRYGSLIDMEDKTGSSTLVYTDNSYNVTRMEESFAKPLSIVLNGLCCTTLLMLPGANPTRSEVTFSILFLLSRTTMFYSMTNPWLLSDPRNIMITDLSAEQHLDGLTGPMLSFLTLMLVIMKPEIDMFDGYMLVQAVSQMAWWWATLTLVHGSLVRSAAHLDTVSLGMQLAFAARNWLSVATASAVMVDTVCQLI